MRTHTLDIMEQRTQPSLFGRRNLQYAKEKSTASAITILLTLSVIVFWLPNTIVFTMASIDERYYNQAADIITSNMLNVESLLDPLWFCIASQDFRRAVKNLLRSRSSR